MQRGRHRRIFTVVVVYRCSTYVGLLIVSSQLRAVEIGPTIAEFASKCSQRETIFLDAFDRTSFCQFVGSGLRLD